MTLLTTQRIIANGLAQLRFEQIWPDLSRIERPTESTLQGLCEPEARGAARADRPARPRPGAQGGRVQPVAADAPARALGDARRARARGRPRGVLHRRGGPEAAHAEHRGLPRRPRVPRALRDRCRRRRPQPAARRERLHQHRAALEPRGPRAAHRPHLPARASAARSTSTTWSASPASSRASRTSSDPRRRFFTGLFDGTTDEVAFERSGSFLSRIERIVAPALAPAPARAEEPPFRRTAPPSARSTRWWRRATSRVTPRPARPGRRRCRPRPKSSARSGLTVQHTAHGGLVIEAPPETASTLAALFSGMAQLLQAAALGPAPRPR